MLRALVAGHVCIDMIPGLAGPVDLAPGGLVEVGPIALRPGGCVANTGRVLLALGAPARGASSGVRIPRSAACRAAVASFPATGRAGVPARLAVTGGSGGKEKGS